jgi:TIR domain
LSIVKIPTVGQAVGATFAGSLSAMADVFVSYAKTDRSLASKLVAMLEAEGWKVWWDTSLATADLYRDEIMKQLASARAVIAIWTPNSIRSDWVRAEAGRAKAEGKLIPVKTPDVAYADIPLPFGEMHTENLESIELIRAAIVAQLAKPAVEPSPWALLGKGFKYEVLTWVGIVGGALTLFTNLGAVLKLADWARVLVQHWKEWTHAFWVWAFSWLGIHLSLFWSAVLSFMMFWSLLTIGQAVRFGLIVSTPQTNYHERSFSPDDSWRIPLCLALLIPLPIIVEGFIGSKLSSLPHYLSWNGFVFYDWPGAVFDLAILIAGLIVLVLCARHKVYASLSGAMISIFYVIITFYNFLPCEPTTEAPIPVVYSFLWKCLWSWL